MNENAGVRRACRRSVARPVSPAGAAAGIDPSTKVTVGYDATTDALAYIKKGQLGATVDQFPGKQASQALQFLVDYIKNKTQPSQKVIYLSPSTVTTAP